MAFCHQPVQLPLGEHIVGEIQAGILPHHWLILIEDLTYVKSCSHVWNHDQPQKSTVNGAYQSGRVA